MKISVIASKRGWQTKELEKAAKKMCVSLEIRDISVVDKQETEKLGDIILWRSSSLDKFAERTVFLNLLKDKIIINHAIADKPFLANKFFQQKYFEHHSKIECIPTFKFQGKKDLLRAISTKRIRLPVIIKPDSGSQGKNIVLARSKRDIDALGNDISKLTVQKFVENQGDFRVLMLGGKMIGAIKRTAGKNSFLNNLAQGGSAEKIADSHTLEELHQIASKAASIFDLTFCGVDIIFDTKKTEHYFLEVNTVPEWQGFQKNTGVEVAEEIIKHCVALYDRKNKSSLKLAEGYYRQNYFYLYDKKFHFASRLYLWLHDKEARKKLEILKTDYLKSPSQKIRKILSEKNIAQGERMLNKDLREQYFKKYPKLLTYNKILFMNLFASTIYGKDLRKTIGKIVGRKIFLDLYKRLSADKKAVAILSTHAINYFYLLQYYLDKERKKINIVDPKSYLDIAINYFSGKYKKNLDLQVYLLTHCIIGESYFYSQAINDNTNICQKMIQFLESLISKNYFDVSLDNKFEFLVCAELCQYNSSLQQMIFAEAERSLSNTGNFLIDRINDVSKKNIAKNNFISAEHRNILYIMAKKEFVLNNRKQ
jgi:RimK family alpha-L-glutamate ligase